MREQTGTNLITEHGSLPRFNNGISGFHSVGPHLELVRGPMTHGNMSLLQRCYVF